MLKKVNRTAVYQCLAITGPFEAGAFWNFVQNAKKSTIKTNWIYTFKTSTVNLSPRTFTVKCKTYF